MTRKLNISMSLMVLAILAIIFFQGYWLYKTFKEERQTLNLRSNILFRESIFQSQAARFSMDTTGSVNMYNRIEAIRIVDNVKTRMLHLDSVPGQKEKSLFLTYNTKGEHISKPGHSNPGDSDPTVIGYGNRMSDNTSIDSVSRKSGGGRVVVRNRQLDSQHKSGPAVALEEVRLEDLPRRRTFAIAKRGDAFFNVLQGVDMIQDSLTIPDISRRLKQSLELEKINIPFSIGREEVDSSKKRETSNFENSNEVIVGFMKPVQFTLGLQNTTTYLLKRISPQIIISLLLVALTTVSFVVLYRNLIRQRKLTQLKNDFISNITHELKTPIATVSVAVEAMKSFNALADPKRTEEYLTISANELQRLSLLVDKVLRLSMFEKQEIELKKEGFDLKQLVEEVVASMRLQFEKSGANVELDLPATAVSLTADRLHVTSVIYNLLDNALKYTKGKPMLRVVVKETENEVVFSVEDNGNGIAAEYQAKVFDKFFRVPTGNQHNVKGYGLGLSYVAYVIERHNGIIQLQSEPEVGSTFIITLPRA